MIPYSSFALLTIPVEFLATAGHTGPASSESGGDFMRPAS